MRRRALAVLAWPVALWVLHGCNGGSSDASSVGGDVLGDGPLPLVESAFSNLEVSPSDGPEGRTDIQILAGFDDGKVPVETQPAPDGGYLRVDNVAGLEAVSGGAEGTPGALRIRIPQSSTGPARLAWVAAPETLAVKLARANSHSLRMSVQDGIGGEGRLIVEGTARAALTHPDALGSSELTTDVEIEKTVVWSGDDWQEIVVRSAPTRIGGSADASGFDALLDGGELWRSLTEIRWELSPPAGSAREWDVFVDELEFYYENPFCAAFPQVSVRWSEPGALVSHPVVVWNTHRRNARSFLLEPGGWRREGASWWGGEVAIRDKDGAPITKTPILLPGQGYLFFVEFAVPLRRPDGTSYQEGDAGIYLLSLVDADTVGSEAPERVGIGLVLKTLVSLNLAARPVLDPPPIVDFRVSRMGGSWVELAWTAPDGGSAALAYAIRCSRSPITDETSWRAATPVENAPAVAPAGTTQTYTLRGLRFQTRYYAAIRCFNEDGISLYLSSLSFITGSGVDENADVIVDNTGDSGGTGDDGGDGTPVPTSGDAGDDGGNGGDPAPNPEPEPRVSVTLAWDAPTTDAAGNPLTDLAGYKVYVGTSSRVYTNVLFVGNVLEQRIDGLSPDVYYFAVTAYDTSGNESEYSEELVVDLR